MAVTLTKGTGPAVDMTKHRAAHPDLTKRFDKAGISLSKRGLDGIRAQAVMLLDHSGSMRNLYKNGTVQTLVERALAFALQVDLDGVIPVYAFDSVLWKPVEVTIDNYQGVVDRDLWRRREMGGTNMAQPFRTMIEIAESSDAPLFVIVVGDGSPSDRGATTRAVCELANHPAFVKFLAVEQVDYLQTLDDLGPSKRRVDNVDAKFLPDVAAVSDLAFADAMTEEWDTWIAAAQEAGIVT